MKAAKEVPPAFVVLLSTMRKDRSIASTHCTELNFQSFTLRQFEVAHAKANFVQAGVGRCKVLWHVLDRLEVFKLAGIRAAEGVPEVLLLFRLGACDDLRVVFPLVLVDLFGQKPLHHKEMLCQVYVFINEFLIQFSLYIRLFQGYPKSPLARV